MSRDADKTFKTQVIGPDQAVIEKRINKIIQEFSDLVVLRFKRIDIVDEDIQSRIFDRYLRTEVVSPNEVRGELGLPEREDGDTVLPFPTKIKKDGPGAPPMNNNNQSSNPPKARVDTAAGSSDVNANGERFCEELGRRDYVTGEMVKNKGPFRLVLNSAASKEIEWHCKHYVGRKLMKFYNTGKELAQEMNVPVEILDTTFKNYNEYAKSGKDPWGKKYFHNVPLSVNDSFHVAIITPVVHYCMGGVKISTKCEVINKTSAIPGLYAAG